MPPNLNLYVETEEPWRAIAETILERPWSAAQEEDWPNTQPWSEGRLWVGEERPTGPTEQNPVFTDLGLDYRVSATFIYNKWVDMDAQTGAMLLGASRVHRAHGGRGVLLYEFDDLILFWSDDRLVVNERSDFRDQAVYLLGTAAHVGPIAWE